VLIALSGFGGGGNSFMDTTIFIEFLPSDKDWVLNTHENLVDTDRDISRTLLTLLKHGWLLVGPWDNQMRD
jgi:hypothetical protein